MLVIRYHRTLLYALFALGYGIINVADANHPFHVSTAEVEFNPKTRRLEVGLKCQAMDLERGVRLMAGKKIDIESDPQVDELLARYVTDNFYLAVAAPVANAVTPETHLKNSESTETVREFPEPPTEPIKLVGKEFETKWVWLYFELQPPVGNEPLVLVNRVLFEVNTGQINTCLVRQNGKRRALKSTSSQPLQDFDRTWLTASTTE